MEESDDPDQSISVGRQEFRKRRRPSQPMIDKSQQTEVTEKKKQQSISQSTVPKATFSIVTVPGNDSSYSDKEYEPFRVSSQLQQTWTKRKHGQKTTDKSFQTDTSAKEKKVVKSLDEPVGPEEKPAGIGKAGSELPENVQGVEITPSLYSVQLKRDRSQQTNCTGDWSMTSIPQVEKMDKEQQTYISGKEIVVISRAGSSFIKSKESVQIYISSGKTFVSEYTEFQQATSSHEGIRQKNISRDLFTQETSKDTPLLLEVGSKQEDSFVKKGASVEIEPLPTEKVLAEGQASPAEEVTAEVEPRLVEETPIEMQPTIEKTLIFDKATSTTEASVAESPSLVEGSLSLEPLVKIQPPLVEEALSEDPFGQVESSPAKVAPSEELPAEIQHPLAEETPFEVQPTVAEDESGEAPAKVEPAEKIPSEVQPPSAEEAPTEVILESGLLTTTEALNEEAPAEVQSLTAMESPVEEPSPKVQPLIAEEGSVEEFLVAVQHPPAEEAPAEIQPPSFGESPTEEAPAETQPPPAEEVLAEEAPTEVQSPSLEQTLREEILAQIQSPPDEEASPEEGLAQIQSPPDEEAFPEEVPPKVQSPSFEKAPIEEMFDEALFPEAPSITMIDVFTETEEFFTEKTLAEVQSVSAEGIPLDVSVDNRLSSTHVVPLEEFPVQEMPPEVSPPSEQTPSNEAVLENVSSELHSPQIAGVSELVDLKDDENFEEEIPVREDLSTDKEELVSTIEIKGTLKTDLKDPS